MIFFFHSGCLFNKNYFSSPSLFTTPDDKKDFIMPSLVKSRRIADRCLPIVCVVQSRKRRKRRKRVRDKQIDIKKIMKEDKKNKISFFLLYKWRVSFLSEDPHVRISCEENQFLYVHHRRWCALCWVYVYRYTATQLNIDDDVKSSVKKRRRTRKRKKRVYCVM